MRYFSFTLLFALGVFLCNTPIIHAQDKFSVGDIIAVKVNPQARYRDLDIAVKVIANNIEKVALWDGGKFGKWSDVPDSKLLFLKVRVELKKENTFILAYQVKDGFTPSFSNKKIKIETIEDKSVKKDPTDGIKIAAEAVETAVKHRDKLSRESKLQISRDGRLKNEIQISPNGIKESDKIDHYVITHHALDSAGNTISTVTKRQKYQTNDGKPIDSIFELTRVGERNRVEVYGETKDNRRIKNTENVLSFECADCTENYSANINNLYTRAIVGYQLTGAASASANGKPFLDFHFTAPLFKDLPSNSATNDNQKEVRFPWLSLWGNVRLTTFSEQQSANNTTFGSAFNGFNPIASTDKINSVVQSFDVVGGLEVKLRETKKQGLFGFKQRTALSFIFGGGFSNPLNSVRTAQTFLIPTSEPAKGSFETLFPDAKGFENIAFVKRERSRFYRQYFAGLRTRTLMYNRSGDLLNASPATFDITLGQNEALTEKIRGVILGLEGFYPFPNRRFDYVYFFGSAKLRLGRINDDGERENFLLKPIFVQDVFDDKTYILPITESRFLRSHRDQYSAGIGIDFINLIKSWGNRSQL